MPKNKNKAKFWYGYIKPDSINEEYEHVDISLVSNITVTTQTHLMITRFPFTSTLSNVSLFDRDILAVDLEQISPLVVWFGAVLVKFPNESDLSLMLMYTVWAGLIEVCGSKRSAHWIYLLSINNETESKGCRQRVVMLLPPYLETLPSWIKIY